MVLAGYSNPLREDDRPIFLESVETFFDFIVKRTVYPLFGRFMSLLFDASILKVD